MKEGRERTEDPDFSQAQWDPKAEASRSSGYGRGLTGDPRCCYLLLEVAARQTSRSLAPSQPSRNNQGPGDKTSQMSWSNICTTFPAFTKKAFSTQSTLGDELGRQSLESPLKLTL